MTLLEPIPVLPADVVGPVHFIAIGGAGMSGIAQLYAERGIEVTGSDQADSAALRRLASFGIRTFVGHRAEQIGNARTVVVSSAVKESNPELAAARDKGLLVWHRSAALAALMMGRTGISIAGTHGKTTTSAMTAVMLGEAGADPSYVIGAPLQSSGASAHLGAGSTFVVEADESDGSFLKLTPVVAVVTNIDAEHLDHFGTLEHLKSAFAEFTNRVPFYGLAVMCLDHPNVQALLPLVEKRVVTYGFAAQADYRADEVRLDGFMTRFKAFRRGEDLGEFAVRMVGRHNAQNALATIAVAEELQIPLAVVRDALSSFGGVQRRFTVKGEEAGVTVVDDYGHHPAEVRATLKGAKQAFNRRVICAFQPHRYTRTHLLMDDFATAFNDADVLFVTEVYAAGEEPIAGATGERVAEAIKACGHRDVTFVPTRAELATAIRTRVQAGDIVITQGAGDVNQSGVELLGLLKDGKAP